MTQKTRTRIIHGLLIIALSIALTQAIQITHAQTSTNNGWTLNLSIENGQNIATTTFSPFDQIEVRANVTYENATVPNILVTFKVQGLSNSVNITRIETTDANGQAEFSFRLPIESQTSAAESCQVTATIQTTNGVLQQNLSFKTQWNMEITSLILQNEQGQNQTSFPPGDNIAIQIGINNNGQPQAVNITVNALYSSGSVINQTEILNKQIGASSSGLTQVKCILQIPSNATLGQASIVAEIFSGNYQNENLPVSENKTVGFTIGGASPTPTPTPKPNPFENSISLFSWLLIATGFFTFTVLIAFLRRKPGAQFKTPIFGPVTPSTTTLIQSTAPQETIQGAVISSQADIQPIGNEPLSQTRSTLLSRMQSSRERIKELRDAMSLEQDQLAKDLKEFTQTIDKEERKFKAYFDELRKEIAKSQGFLPPAKDQTTEIEKANIDEKSEK